MVKVLEVDLPRKRIALSIKQTQAAERGDNKGSRSKTSKNCPDQKHSEKQKESSSMEDAMNLLRKKFGK
jgi:uncharacterized protein